MKIDISRYTIALQFAFLSIMFGLLMGDIGAQEIVPIRIRSMAWSSDGIHVALGKTDGGIEIWDLSMKKLNTTIQLYSNDITVLAWSFDGQQLAVASNETVKIVNTSSGEVIHTLSGHEQLVGSIQWSLDDKYLYTATTNPDYSPTLRKWDLDTEMPVESQMIVAGGLTLVPGGQLIIGGNGIYNYAFDTETLAIVKKYSLSNKLDENPRISSTISVSQDGKSFAVGYLDGWVRTWDIATERITNQWEAHNQHPACCASTGSQVTAVYYDGTTLESVTQDGTFRIWDVLSGDLLEDEKTTTTNARTLFSPYGQRLSVLTDIPTNTVNVSLDGVDTFVPSPSLERFQRLSKRCTSLTDGSIIPYDVSAMSLTELTEQIKMLPSNTIPSACAADLIALAEAILSEQE